MVRTIARQLILAALFGSTCSVSSPADPSSPTQAPALVIHLSRERHLRVTRTELQADSLHVMRSLLVLQYRPGTPCALQLPCSPWNLIVAGNAGGIANCQVGWVTTGCENLPRLTTACNLRIVSE